MGFDSAPVRLAHFIKDRRCNTARAVFALELECKWALSGTPLQNRVGELYSLIRFLQIFPYSYYFCKDCSCEILDTSMKKQCDCGHSSVRHFCWWNKYISTPIQYGSTSFEGKRAMTLLKEKVLKGIVLRRTKKGRAADLALPPKIVTLRRDSFDKNEMEFYEALYTQSVTQFDAYVDAGTLLNNYAHIFDLLTRLRQSPSASNCESANTLNVNELSEKISQTNLHEVEHVIIPEHLRVPEYEQTKLSFGSFTSGLDSEQINLWQASLRQDVDLLKLFDIVY
ncbi:DNA repair protein RAD16 [Zea mays]|uniref:DNA repair protein RAD16 n=1 Tax=Zea mays TaxID=4577 RepID=UPI0009A9E0A9|nr:DNA repair protein RAD16 [Zea mays]|eukprot:XP_020399227.1 DNA repair protein RAD16 [Zea mays]